MTIPDETTRGRLERITVRLWSDDIEFLRREFPANYNYQLREVLARWIESRKEDQNDD